MMDDDVVLQGLMNVLCTLKKEYVLKNHVNKNGTPKRIEQKIHDGKTVWVTRLKDGSKKTALTEERLYDKLFTIYAVEDPNINLDEFKSLDNNHNYSVRAIFKKAFAEKAESFGFTETTEGTVSSVNTLDRYRQDYDRFIDENFAKEDIRFLQPNDIKKYCIETLNRLHSETGEFVKYKAFKDHFKAVLRLIWGYADEHDICSDIISNRNKFKTDDFKKLLDCSKPKAEEKAFDLKEIELIDEEIGKRMGQPGKYGICYTNGYMFRLSRWTGMRVGELGSLKWSDINFSKKTIHVHTQQLKNHKTYEVINVPWTKAEQGNPSGGRFIPMFPQTIAILEELKEKQQLAGIKSEYVFANPDGSFISVDSQYIQFLQRISKKFGFGISNNHAIRIYFNSYVLVPAGVSLPNRAKILGHSEEVNLKYYTFEDREYLVDVNIKVTTYISTIEKKDETGDA
ncbi:MAG: tyrosine-type recombinase/integrase [Lachnospiraceae bacterium]|nr:tyrosine-type recombinase/integrase [Lachnospiraceae bacterium]